MNLIPLRPGQRFTLPTGRRVELLRHVTIGGDRWHCAYLRGEGVMPEGHGYANRVTLSQRFLQNFATE